MSKRALEKKAKALAAKFHEDAQELFDDERMTESIYDGEVMQALLTMQQDAEDVENAE